MKESRCFTLLKLYSESGIGFNLYFEGWRLIGLDYHNWQIKQDPKTGTNQAIRATNPKGKPLSPEEFFFCPPRLHIDIPNWNLHHWPYEQHQDDKTLREAMAIKKAKRDEQAKSKQAKKLLKQQRKAQAALQPQVADNDEEEEPPTMDDLFG